MTRPSVIFQTYGTSFKNYAGNFLHNLRQHCLLFYCYRLRQISWLIHILPFANGYMVGQ